MLNYRQHSGLFLCKPTNTCTCSLHTSLSEGGDGDLVALLSGGPLGGVVREGLLGHGLGLGGLLEARPDGAGCPGDELRNKVNFGGREGDEEYTKY